MTGQRVTCRSGGPCRAARPSAGYGPGIDPAGFGHPAIIVTSGISPEQVKVSSLRLRSPKMSISLLIHAKSVQLQALFHIDELSYKSGWAPYAG